MVATALRANSQTPFSESHILIPSPIWIHLMTDSKPDEVAIQEMSVICSRKPVEAENRKGIHVHASKIGIPDKVAGPRKSQSKA